MDFNYLDCSKLHFEESQDGTLRVIVEGERCGLQVQALRAFPLKFPEEFIVLRDGGNVEIGVLRSLADLPESARATVRMQLRNRYFLPRITAILGVSERFGSSLWDVETDRGPRKISTNAMNEAVTEVSPGRYLLTDVEKNRYEIADIDALDPASRARFSGL
jgi:hypothetical protein